MSEGETQDKPAETQEQEYVFPPIPDDAIGGHHIDQKTNTFWIGVVYTRLDYHGACAFVDSMKVQLWMLFRELGRQMAMAQANRTAAERLERAHKDAVAKGNSKGFISKIMCR